ncbi:PREDICTED: lysosomal-associated transmembrane protein 4A-like [Branchiostoma belcheri]|uniref:Lysosomal-associated transmembrane protein 4A-like n=1 Tax=Branchiostoma belcheri TaxID=7741 RepID=A0A6P4XML1_BRABE|nr:PREDICTED: lysosomal-associated transmembrane protein 4A-like [Branchiostoma belcheri]
MQAKEGMKRGEFRCCCGCLHVRAGAIMIGLLHLVCHLLGMLVLAYLITHPEAMPKGDTWYSLNYNGNETARGSDNCVALAITFFTFTMTLLMLYGAIKHRAGYLLPFFCIQVFDFTVGCLTAIGFVSYMPNIRTFMEQNPNLPYREELMKMDPQYLLLICMAIFFLVMIIKVRLLQEKITSCLLHVAILHYTVEMGSDKEKNTFKEKGGFKLFEMNARLLRGSDDVGEARRLLFIAELLKVEIKNQGIPRSTSSFFPNQRD